MKISRELEIITSYAAEEAARTGCDCIHTDHLMLAILRHSSNGACRILSESGVDPDAFKQTLDRYLFSRKYASESRLADMKMSEEARSTAGMTLAQVGAAGRDLAEPEDLLLAICRNRNSLSTAYLKDHGITFEALKKKVDATRKEIIQKPRQHAIQMVVTASKIQS